MIWSLDYLPLHQLLQCVKRKIVVSLIREWNKNYFYCPPGLQATKQWYSSTVGTTSHLCLVTCMLECANWWFNLTVS